MTNHTECLHCHRPVLLQDDTWYTMGPGPGRVLISTCLTSPTGQHQVAGGAA